MVKMVVEFFCLHYDICVAFHCIEQTTVSSESDSLHDKMSRHKTKQMERNVTKRGG